jgi:hypothetical protein
MTVAAARGRRGWAGPILQLLGSLLVLYLLLREVEPDELRDAIAMVDLRWLAAVLPIKALGVTLHELRLYLALRPWAQPPLSRVLGIGYCSGLVNTLLPLRGGDLLAVALLRLECRVSTVAALTAVAATSVLEMMVFGFTLLALLLVQGPAWATGAASLNLEDAARDMSILTAGATMGVAGLVILLRKLYKRHDERAPPATSLRSRIADAGRGLGVTSVGINLILALAQVGLFLTALLTLFHALGMAPVPALLAACLVQAGNSMAAAALPQTFGAGQAASTVLVLAAFGIAPPQALAMAVLIWATHQLTVFSLGSLPLLRRIGHLAKLRRRG